MGKEVIHLTSAEIGNLWSSYMNDTMTTCVLDYFLAQVEDGDIRPVIERSLQGASSRVAFVKQIFEQEKIPIPVGFSEADVNTTAPRLYSDTYFLHYVCAFAAIGIGVYGRCLVMSSREDVRAFYTQCVVSMTEQFNQATEPLLAKGLYVRAPYISIPKQVEFVKKESYLAGLFSEPRTLNALEISTLWSNIMSNTLGKAMIMGFSQVAKSTQCREYFVRGKDIASKHMQIFSATLLREDIPSPITWDSDVKDSTVAPFSDKLMMYHTIGLISTGLGNYGLSIASSQRRDLSLTYARLMAEVAEYANDGATLMVEHGWMEEPPHAEDRDKLAGV